MSVAAFLVLALFAQGAPTPTSPEAKAKAQALLSEGAALFEKGAVAKALEKFNQAYEEFPSPKLLFNIAQSSRKLGLSVDAVKAFERFLAEAPDAPVDMTAEAKRSVVELTAAVGRLSVECSTAGAEISIDGNRAGFAPISDPLWIMPGHHTVTARHPNYLPATAGVDIDPGTVHTVALAMQLKLQAQGGPTRATMSRAKLAESSTNLEKTPPPSQHGLWLGRTWAWVATGTTVVFAGTATYFGLSMKSKFNSLNDSCGSNAGTLSCSESDVDSVGFRRNMANVFWGLTAAAAVTAGVLFVVEDHSVTVAPVADGRSVGMLAGASF
jgi:hypothetical protein